MIYQGKICGKGDREKCKKKHGKYLGWQCGKCMQGGQKIRWRDVGPYTHHILWLRTLQRSGYIFPEGLFDLDDWEDIGLAAEISDAINEGKNMQMLQYLFVGGSGKKGKK